jgi:DNA-binding XRE family transcriptional regulator
MGQTCHCEQTGSRIRKGQWTMPEVKVRQSSKIKELREALIRSGLLTVDEQAKALGLSRSTTWHIQKGHYKNSGLSAAIINRMLNAPQLPPLVRVTLLEYVEEKSAGLHGHSARQLRRFASLLSVLRHSPDRLEQRPASRHQLTESATSF